jgi:hypothetical protein
MLAVDYDWDIHPWGIILDRELPVSWKQGDFFVYEKTETGHALVKAEDVTQFLLRGQHDKEEVSE